jgi:hypothetical protein
MAESQSHKRAKNKAAGRNGRTEVPISGGRRLDAKKGHRATEVERSGNPKGISKAISRLKTQKNAKKELLVPNKDLDKAKKIAKRRAVNVLIQNLSRSKRRFV